MICTHCVETKEYLSREKGRKNVKFPTPDTGISPLFVLPMSHKDSLNPLTPVSDQSRISPYYIDTVSCRQMMRIKKSIECGITC